MKKLIIIIILLASFKGFAQFKNGTDGLILTNNKTALENEALFKKSMYNRVITISKVDSMYYETIPQKYGNFNWSYKYRFIIRDSKIMASVFTRTDYTNTKDFYNLKVIGGESHYSKDLYSKLNDILLDVGGNVK